MMFRTAILVLGVVSTSNAFLPASPSAPRVVVTSTTTTRLAAALPSPEESAKALTDYMAKAHEEKLKAVKAAEDAKNAEIQALKAELESKPAESSAITTTAASSSTDIEELQQKLISYQNFMAKYIVEAQEQKARAVAEAQAALVAKYQLTAAAPVAADAPTLATKDDEPKLYSDRNAKVSAAAAAGKSRWGESEVNRLASGIATAPAAAPAAAAAAPAVAAAVSAADSASVAAADHGLRNDGGVGGPSLAERVAGGAGGGSVGVADTKLYQDRSANVLAAGAAKSRWGEAEVTRLSSGIATAPKMAPAGAPVAAIAASAPTDPKVIVAADHGLRHDGGVGGPSLAERLASGANGAVVASSSSATTMLYYNRNQAIAAAGASSRWGPMEVAKATELAAAAPPSAGVAVVETEEIKAADHGLRNDGGVSGPSLAERVNLGAQLLGA